MPAPRRKKDAETDDFYRAFEERNRGSRGSIRSRLRQYLPFIEPLKLIETEARAVDFGCGRGEWLELLQEVGFHAHGVDLDEGMLAACRKIGLQVTRRDAVSFLRELPSPYEVSAGPLAAWSPRRSGSRGFVSSGSPAGWTVGAELHRSGGG
jgi:SAM-dependent methyltransferase